MKYLLAFLALWSFANLSVADIESSKGIIRFDVDADSNAEATLSATGLGIGTTAQANLQVAGNSIISKQLLLGTSSSAASNLHISGTVARTSQVLNSETILSAYSLVLADSSSSSNLFLYLPSASSCQGRIYNIKKVSTSNNVVISGTENIDATDSYLLGEGNLGSLEVFSNGTQWYIISTKNGEATSSPSIVSVTAND